MCKELSEGKEEPNSQWQYDNYYREVSSLRTPQAGIYFRIGPSSPQLQKWFLRRIQDIGRYSFREFASCVFSNNGISSLSAFRTNCHTNG